VTVHYVDVDHVTAFLFNLFNGSAKMRKICTEQRRGKKIRSFHTCIVANSLHGVNRIP